MHDTAIRRPAVWSDEYLQSTRRQQEERHQEELRRYSERLAIANYAIRSALRALGDGDAARATRELRRAVE